MENMDNEKKYSDVVITLKRLLMQKKITVSQVRQMLTDGKITAEEYEYIIKK